MTWIKQNILYPTAVASNGSCLLRAWWPCFVYIHLFYILYRNFKKNLCFWISGFSFSYRQASSTFPIRKEGWVLRETCADVLFSKPDVMVAPDPVWPSQWRCCCCTPDVDVVEMLFWERMAVMFWVQSALMIGCEQECKSAANHSSTFFKQDQANNYPI